MMRMKNKGSAVVVMVVIAAMMIVAIVFANRWLQKQASSIVSEPAKAPTVLTPQKKVSAPVKKGKEEVIRKTQFSPDRKYSINVFYQGGVEIARNRSSRSEGVYDQVGNIPDGRVKFINESKETYGVEYYRDQKLHNTSKIYYRDGAIKEEIYYQYGELKTSVEYFYDGAVRMERDYTDAREYFEEDEVGVGKVYFRDGTLKYEWSMTNGDPVGFKKSYNGQGELVSEVYYDGEGKIAASKEAAANSMFPNLISPEWFTENP